MTNHIACDTTRKSGSFLGLNDSLIAAQIAAEYLLIPVVDPSLRPPGNPIDPVNQRGSDFSFLTMLARRNGFEVLVRFDKLYFRFPRPQTETVTLEWGKDLMSFSPRLSTAGLPGLVEVQGYNEELAQAIVAILPSMAASLDSFEMLGENAASLLLSLGRRKIESPDVSNPVSAATLAMAELKALLEGLAEASGTTPGTPRLRAGEQVRIAGVGKRFSGVYRLRRVTHTISDRGYETRFEASQRASMSLLDSLRDKVARLPLPDAPTAPQGLVLGLIESNVDPGGQDRVLVQFPTISENLRCWARVARPDAGKKSGTFFIPDIGDEVVVAFLHGGLNSAIVLGSLWSRTRPPPVSVVNPLNFNRVIQTKAGHRVEFDDTPGFEKLIVKHATVGQLSMEATPAGSKVSLEDSLGNRVNIDGSKTPPGSSAITIESTGSITLTASKEITLKGSSINLQSESEGITLSAAGQPITLKSNDIDLTVTNAVNVKKG